MRSCDYYLTWLSLHSLCSSVLHVSQRRSEHESRLPTAVPVIVIITHTCLAAARRRWGVWPRLMEGHKLLQAFSAKSRAIENPFIRHTHTPHLHLQLLAHWTARYTHVIIRATRTFAEQLWQKSRVCLRDPSLPQIFTHTYIYCLNCHWLQSENLGSWLAVCEVIVW